MVAATEKGTIHIDQALTNISVGYKNAEYIGTQVLPVVPVAKQSDKYFVYGKEAFMLSNDERANGAPSNKVNSWSTTAATAYFCDKHSLHDIVTDDDRANADAPINPDVDTTEFLTEKLLLRREYTIAAYLFNTSTFSGYTETAANLSAKWNDYLAGGTDSTPLDDIDEKKDAIQLKIGRDANVCVIGADVWTVLKRHPSVLEAFKYTAGGIVTPQMFAELIGVERLLIGKSVYNSAKEGGTETMARLWGDYCLLAYVSNAPSLKSPSLGYVFQWKLYGTNQMMVEKWRAQDNGGDKVQVSTAYDVLMTATGAGYLISDCL